MVGPVGRLHGTVVDGRTVADWQLQAAAAVFGCRNVRRWRAYARARPGGRAVKATRGNRVVTRALSLREWMCIQWTYTCLSWEVPVLGHKHTAKLIAKDTAPRESPGISLVGNLPRYPRVSTEAAGTRGTCVAPPRLSIAKGAKRVRTAQQVPPDGVPASCDGGAMMRCADCVVLPFWNTQPQTRRMRSRGACQTHGHWHRTSESMY